MIYKRRVVIAAATSALALVAQAQDAGNEPLEQVVVTGTRVANRSALDTAVPVDVVSSEQLQNVGVAELNQSLAVALPSFNFPRPGLADGTDTIRPAALRGLAPDQTLVLVNGKRRHAASLVNVNGTIGRGSSAVGCCRLTVRLATAMAMAGFIASTMLVGIRMVAPRSLVVS